MTHDVNIGTGRSSGMFYFANKGTALPSSLTNLSLSAWTEVGNISEDGMELALDRSKESIKNWANKIVRVILTDHSEKATGALIDTTEEAMTALFGADAVSVSAATASHGKVVTVNLSESELPEEKAYLFIVKDGDDMIAFGCKDGQISSADNISFTPGDAIKWPFEIEAMGEGMVLIKDNGQTTGSSH